MGGGDWTLGGVAGLGDQPHPGHAPRSTPPTLPAEGPAPPPCSPLTPPSLQAAELGCSLREASTRVFSNSSGSYSSNVNLAVENSSWSDEQQLQVRGRPGGRGGLCREQLQVACPCAPHPTPHPC